MVNVVKSNFLEKSQDLIDRLPTAAYAAIDLEMTGITIPGTGRPTRDDTPQDRYPKLRPVPERYSIIQVGVALFHENPDYTAWVEAAAAGGGSISSSRKAMPKGRHSVVVFVEVAGRVESRIDWRKL
mmetsp:Transcript_19649/g.42822  ORF Transcript_19649/g.42822 Transcript_19649/m.42822 type:complete len:127 (+) Transcript_19649:149-529(+)